MADLADEIDVWLDLQDDPDWDENEFNVLEEWVSGLDD